MSTSTAMAGNSPLVSIEQATKRFGDLIALQGVSLELGAGEFLALLGPNGAGKSTLIRSIVGRVRLDSGTVDVAGNPAGSDAARSFVGYVPQEVALYPKLSAEENLGTFGEYLGLRGAELRKAIEWCLEWAALGDRRRGPVGDFSGGMKRRLNMAAGLIHRPKIVLMDEPTVGVDPQSRERIYAMIESLRTEGMSMIYTTHYMEEAERLCDRIAIIDHGHVIANDSAANLVRASFGTHRELLVTFAAEPDEAGAQWLRQRGAKVVGATAQFTVSDPAREVADILQALAAQGIEVRDMSVKTPTLESVFLQLTGRDLRE